MKDFPNAPVPRDPMDAIASEPADLIRFSHLRWDNVFQRPQQLMSRFAPGHRVLFVEEAIPGAHHLPYLEFHAFEGASVTAVRPRIPDHAGPAEGERLLARLLDQLVALLRCQGPGPVALHADDVARRGASRAVGGGL